MGDGSDRAPAVPLQRPDRLRPSWLRRLVRLVMIGLCVAILAGRSDLAIFDRGSACATAVRVEQPDAAQVCQQEFARTQNSATGVLLAKALYAKGDTAAATRIANGLILTPARADAFQLLGLFARNAGRNDDAMIKLVRARELHSIEHNPRGLAVDDGVIAMIQIDRSEFAEALRLIDECIQEAGRDADPKFRRYCHVAAAKALIQMGYWSAAKQEIDRARSLSIRDIDLSDLEYQVGNLHQERADHWSAIAAFQHAEQLRTSSPDTSWTITTELNIAYSCAELGRFLEALQHLENATVLDAVHEKEAERDWVAAQIAYQQHDLAHASSLAEKYFQLRSSNDAVDRDDRIDVASLQARIELERGDLPRAKLHARRGVEEAERVRSAQSVLELRPSVLAKRRAPYELLFTALARSHQTEAAAMAFDQWQGRTVQDALATPRPLVSVDYLRMADQIAQLSTWLPAIAQAAFARSPDQDSVLRTMRSIDLLALVVAEHEVWSLTANHGPPRLARLGPAPEIKELVDQFRGHPTDVKRASNLGALLLPDESFRETHEVLHVILDGELGALPVAALRHGETPLIAMRPIVRMLRLPEIRCAHVTRSGHSTVLAAPGDQLDHARAEAEQVAGLLHTTSQTGGAATRAALFAAAGDSILHVAAHGVNEPKGAALRMADGDVSALEILVRGVAPSLAVLSACNSATSDDEDPELARSLVAGFLGAGSQHVVATLGAILDSDAPDITTRFYRAGGVADPARALATVQAALAGTNNVDWPYFAVFGPDVCPEAAPDPH